MFFNDLSKKMLSLIATNVYRMHFLCSSYRSESSRIQNPFSANKLSHLWFLCRCTCLQRLPETGTLLHFVISPFARTNPKLGLDSSLPWAGNEAGILSVIKFRTSISAQAKDGNSKINSQHAEFAIEIFKLFRHALVLVFSLFHWLVLSLKFRAGKYLRLNRKKYNRQNFEAIKYIKAFLCIWAEVSSRTFAMI